MPNDPEDLIHGLSTKDPLNTVAKSPKTLLTYRILFRLVSNLASIVVSLKRHLPKLTLFFSCTSNRRTRF